MIVYLQSLQVLKTEGYLKDLEKIPEDSKEYFWDLLRRFLKHEKLSSNHLKIFKIAKDLKVLEFRVKDQFGNWRFFSTVVSGKYLVLLYAFHKKSQELQERDKETIRRRFQRAKL